MSDAGTESSETVDYRGDLDATLALLDRLDTGDRVHITADAAVLAERDDHSNLFARGDRVLIDDTAEIVSAEDDGVVVELDEQGVLTGDDDGYGANTFEVKGEAVVARWEVIDEDAVNADTENEGMRWKPVNLQVAMLNSIERLADVEE